MKSSLNKINPLHKPDLSNNNPSKKEGIVIKGNERVFTAGITGSGKTTLTKFLLWNIKRLLVIDSKEGLDDWNTEIYKKGDEKKFATEDHVRIRTFSIEDSLNCLEVIYNEGNCIVYIDEVTAFIPPRSKVPQVVIDIWQRGRSREIGGWATSQRPTDIPLIFLSEAYHFFVFRLNLEKDRKRIAEFSRKEVLRKPIDRYGFYYYDVISDKLKYYARLKI